MRRRHSDAEPEEFFDAEEELRQVGMQIAQFAGDLQSAQASLDHCNLQIRYWRLQQGIATERQDEGRAARASQQCEVWEKRRGQAIKDLKLDMYREILAHITHEKKAEDELSAFPELDDEGDEELDA